jgi:hypothetical protein
MIDPIGHLAYASIVLGTFLVARGDGRGWLLRLAGDATWVGLGLALSLSSVYVWESAFVVTDLLALWRLQTTRAG